MKVVKFPRSTPAKPQIIPENINPNSYLPFEIPGLEIIISVIFITILSVVFLKEKLTKIRILSIVLVTYLAGK